MGATRNLVPYVLCFGALVAAGALARPAHADGPEPPAEGDPADPDAEAPARADPAVDPVVDPTPENVKKRRDGSVDADTIDKPNYVGGCTSGARGADGAAGLGSLGLGLVAVGAAVGRRRRAPVRR